MPTARPNYHNRVDACCRCGDLFDTPDDHEAPGPAELRVWQPNPADPPQWICPTCAGQLEEDRAR